MLYWKQGESESSEAQETVMVWINGLDLHLGK